MPADSYSQIAKIVLFLLGISSVIFFWLTGVRRFYLLYLGIGFCGLGISLFFSVQLPRIIALLVTLYSFVIAVIESIKDTKEKLAAFRKEQQDREIVFAEFQAAIIENEKNQNETIEKYSGDDDAPES